MNKLFVYAFFAGTCFGLWPIVMARSDIKNPVTTTLIVSSVTFSSILLVLFFSKSGGDQSQSLSLHSPFLYIAISAGLLNAIGTLIFQKSMVGMATADQYRIWIIPIIVVATQIVINAVASYFLFPGGSFSWRHLVGICFALVAALLLGVK